jgi:hypothetical protein
LLCRRKSPSWGRSRSQGSIGRGQTSGAPMRL